jgi:hypothetical protein
MVFPIAADQVADIFAGGRVNAGPVGALLDEAVHFVGQADVKAGGHGEFLD